MQTPASPGEKAVSESKKPESIPAERPSQSFSLRIRPETAFRDSVFNAVPGGFSLSDAPITWLVNGKPAAGAKGIKFRPQNAVKGDTVQAEALIQGAAVYSNIIKIKNSPPRADDIKILPEVFRPGDTLSVKVEAVDIDGDDVTVSYEWTKNSEPAGKGRQIDIPLKKGDRFSVRISFFDGEDYGPPVILRREIKNLPPMIAEDNEFNFDGKVYSFQVRASDPDDDPLAFSLESAAEGISIDPETGVVTWNVPADFTGKVPVTVSVTDGQGGKATREITLIINPPSTENE